MGKHADTTLGKKSGSQWEPPKDVKVTPAKELAAKQAAGRQGGEIQREKKFGRPTKGDAPMAHAQRMKAYRARKRTDG